ncbi:MAG: DNA cytosine methyltransferase [Selenomonadaceae bacterium]|nr:DNA cytosine methyltransferase [Selenomonadaceae bacterium]
MYGWKWYMKDIPTPSKLTAFSMFASLGGSSLGYKLAGFDVLGGVEIDKRFARLYQHNLKPKFFWQTDIREFNRLDDLTPQLYELDVLDGSPPCSSFSIVGKREKFWGQKKKFAEGQREQTLDDLVFEYCETVKKLRPKIVVMENVPGLIFSKAKPYAVEVIKKAGGGGL